MTMLADIFKIGTSVNSSKYDTHTRLQTHQVLSLVNAPIGDANFSNNICNLLSFLQLYDYLYK